MGQGVQRGMELMSGPCTCCSLHHLAGQAKGSGGTVFKSGLTEVQVTLTTYQHMMGSRFPLKGGWKIALAHKEGLCGQ